MLIYHKANQFKTERRTKKYNCKQDVYTENITGSSIKQHSDVV